MKRTCFFFFFFFFLALDLRKRCPWLVFFFFFFFFFFFSIGSTQKVSLVRATAKALLVATLSESLPLSSSVNGQKLIISAHIGMKKARSDNYQCCHDNISAVTISVLSRS